MTRSVETNKVLGARLPLYATTLIIGGEGIGPITIDLKTGRVIVPQPNPERDFALEAKDAKIAKMQARLNEAIVQIGEWSRKCGLAEGRLAASEMAGVVEGWRQRAEKAEAELARERDAIDKGGCGEVVMAELGELRRWSAGLCGVSLDNWHPHVSFADLFLVLGTCTMLREAKWELRRLMAQPQPVYEFEIRCGGDRVVKQHESKFMAILLGCREIMSRAKLPSE